MPTVSSLSGYIVGILTDIAMRDIHYSTCYGAIIEEPVARASGFTTLQCSHVTFYIHLVHGVDHNGPQ